MNEKTIEEMTVELEQAGYGVRFQQLTSHQFAAAVTSPDNWTFSKLIQTEGNVTERNAFYEALQAEVVTEGYNHLWRQKRLAYFEQQAAHYEAALGEIAKYSGNNKNFSTEGEPTLAILAKMAQEELDEWRNP